MMILKFVQNRQHCNIVLTNCCVCPGMISCKVSTLDRETKSQYVVVVRAQDMRGMASGSTATTSVTVSVTDTNDNIASFTRREDCTGIKAHLFAGKVGILQDNLTQQTALLMFSFHTCCDFPPFVEKNCAVHCFLFKLFFTRTQKKVNLLKYYGGFFLKRNRTLIHNFVFYLRKKKNLNQGKKTTKSC